MPAPHVAIIGPLNPVELSPWIAPEEAGRMPPPYQQGGAFLTTVLRARLERGMPTIAITSNADATEPIMRWTGPLLRLWVVRRRTRGALRDAYREEIRLLRQALREASAPVTHAHWTYEYARAALEPNAPPAVVTVHDHAANLLRHLGPRYIPHYIMSRNACRRAALLTAPSPFIADYVTRKTGRTVRVIPNMMDVGLLVPRAPRANNSGTATVVILATDAAFKNVRGALAAFALWRSRGATASLRVIGPGLGPDSRIAKWARARRLDAGANFEGPATHRDALDALSTSDILFNPSLEESFGSPVMEAMALGVPVVAAREAGGCRFLLDDGACGRLPSGRSPEEMAQALAAAWTNPTETHDLAGAAQTRIRTICDPDAILNAYEECYATASGRP